MYFQYCVMPVPVAAWSKEWVCGRLLAGIAGSNPAVCIYRLSRGECARLRQNVPYVKVHRHNPKHLYPKLNGYGDNVERSLKV